MTKDKNKDLSNTNTHNQEEEYNSENLTPEEIQELICPSEAELEQTIQQLQKEPISSTSAMLENEEVSNVTEFGDNVIEFKLPPPCNTPIITDQDTAYHNKKYGCLPSAKYCYREKDGSVIGYIVRYDFTDKNGQPDKAFTPYTYNFDQKCWKCWSSKSGNKGFDTPRTLFNLDLIASNPDKTIIVNEGEKSCLASQTLFSEYIPTTSSFGAKSVSQTDISPLVKRNVIMALDYDEAGEKYGKSIKERCEKAGGFKSLTIVNIKLLGSYIIQDNEIVKREGEVPKGYDLADAVKDGWTADFIQQAMNDSRFKELFQKTDIEQIEQEKDKDQSLSDTIQEKIETLNQSSSYNQIKEILSLLPQEELEREFYLRHIQKKTKQQMRSLRKVIKKLEIIEKEKKAEERRIINKEKRIAFNASNEIIDLNQPLAPYLWTSFNDKGNPKPTMDNFKTLLKAYGFSVRYNMISRRCEKSLHGQSFMIDNQDNNIRAEITSVCALNSLKINEAIINSYLNNIAEKNTYNPIEDWINSKEWDGKSRLDELCDTIVTDTPNKKLYLKKWALSAVAAATMKKGFFSKGVLVFQGGQSIGKTSWFKKLLPPEMHDLLLEGASIDPSNKDSVTRVSRRWIVELGELDATFRKADIAKLKAFISSEEDAIRLPYAQEESRLTRRTVFFASVNEKTYLVDNTGNTRWWTLSIKDINYKHDIDIQQFWAECLFLLKQGEQWWLTPEEERLLELNNNEFLSISPFEELLQEKYNFSKLGTQPITATELLIKLGYLNPNKKQRNEMGQVLQKLGVKRNRLSKYLMPPEYEIEEKKLIDTETQYEELKNKQRSQILTTSIRQCFPPYEASIIINECTFDHVSQENKFVLSSSSKFNLPQEQKTQLLQVIKSIYGEGITIVNSNLN